MKQVLNLQELLPRDAEILEAGEAGCTVRLGKNGGGVALPHMAGCPMPYLIGDIEVLEDHSAAMSLRFYRAEEEKERIFMRFGLLPHLKTRICFDLALLDNRTIYTNRTPGALKLVVHGQRTAPEEVARVELGMKDCFHDVTIRMENFFLSDEPAGDYPVPDKKIVDAFGQWKEKDWPGKIHSEEELKQRITAQEGPASYPFPNWNRWGGDSSRPLKPGTGFFSTCKTPDGRWHLTDPDGCDYFSLGPCGVHPGDVCRVDGLEKLCDWLPEENDPLYGPMYHSGTLRRAPYMPLDSFKTFRFTAANLARVYGENWQEKWEEISHHILMSHGLNSQGNFSGLGQENGHTKLPYVRQMMNFPGTKTLIFRDFPDVLSPEYQENAETFAQALESWKDDPWLIGYFLRNEPEFNFVENLVIADEVLRNPADTYCKRGLIAFLAQRYGTVEAMNQSWGSDFDSFDALNQPIPACSVRYPAAKEVLREYSRFLVGEYSRIPAEACRRVDPNHLNLGLRWSKADNADMMAGWQYFDVFSINCYDFDPTRDMDFACQAGVDLPILLGEFHCGALDRGLTATGLKGVKDQHQRAIMFRHYVEKCASHPCGVGAHWFQYNDQFCLGRYDGENYQIGMVDICMQPHPELMEAALKTASVLYQVKNGETAPFAQSPETIPMIGY